MEIAPPPGFVEKLIKYTQLALSPRDRGPGRSTKFTAKMATIFTTAKLQGTHRHSTSGGMKPEGPGGAGTYF